VKDSSTGPAPFKERELDDGGKQGSPQNEERYSEQLTVISKSSGKHKAIGCATVFQANIP
jgi:hypothetical protein